MARAFDPHDQRHSTVDQGGRPADLLMRPERLGAFWPSPLSFSRSLLRDLARLGCTVAREEFTLDQQGEGSAIYRVMIGERRFTFAVISSSVPEEEKTDRVIGVKWDVMASLMAGEMTEGRFAELCLELPKQKVGRSDKDTLVWLRANKSVRAFNHTVARLAQGLEPDVSVLLSTGYLLRTTAFYANGKLGTIAFKGLRQLGALSEPYHAQIMSAWLLREFAFDLVEHLARGINPHAAPLSREARRMSGVGNSAGVGIVPFILRHPRIIDQWMRVHEALLTQISEMTVAKGSLELARFGSLLERAELYFASLPEQDGAYFAAPEQIAAELAKVRGAFASLIVDPGQAGPSFAWRCLVGWVRSHVGAETQEAVNVVLMELYPRLVEAAQPLLTIDDELAIAPDMTLGQLRPLLAESFGWVGEVLAMENRHDVFWYRSDEAGEPRIAERASSDWSRREVFMDLALRIDELGKTIDGFPTDMNVADLLLLRPELYEAVRRAQAELSYGEIRANLVDGRLAPLPLIRFVLAFYGMERFTPGSNRWVRGTFLQGAPTALDLAEGVDGDWPFPVGPLIAREKASGAGDRLVSFRAEKQNLESDGKRSIEIMPIYGYTLLPLGEADKTRVALPELSYLGELALRSVGMPQGAAQKAGEIALLSEIVADSGLTAIAEALRMGDRPGRSWDGFADHGKVGKTRVLSTAGLGLTNFAPYLLEAAALLGCSETGVFLRVEQAGESGGILPGLVLELAKRGILALAVMEVRSSLALTPYWLTVAAFPRADPGNPYPDLATLRSKAAVRAFAAIIEEDEPVSASLFEPMGSGHEASCRGACVLWITRSHGRIAELRNAVSKRRARSLVGEPDARLLFRDGAELAKLVAKAERFGLELLRAQLFPVVEAADRMLLAPSEEGAGTGGRTASWGRG